MTARTSGIAWEELYEVAPSENALVEFWYRLSRNKLTLIGSIVAALFIIVGAVAQWLAPYDYSKQVLSDVLLPPLSPGHILGTDQLGRDLLSRILMGLQVSMMVGVIITAISLFFGTVLGMTAGYYGGKADMIISGLVDITWGFPLILVAVILVGAIGPGLPAVVISIGLINWAGFARIIRGEVLSLREKEFVEAARALGVGDLKIMLRHLLPNVLPPALVMGSYYVALAIIIEAGMSFIGMGAQPPLPSLGQIVAEGRNYMLMSHWVSTLPGLTIVFVVLGLNLLGDGLRDALDPRLKEE